MLASVTVLNSMTFIFFLVLFKPIVVPCPDGPQFHPGWKNPPEMSVHAYWVMRLPFIYCGEFKM